MSPIQTSPTSAERMTQHAMLVIWGLFARRIGLVQAIQAVPLKQKVRVHTPHTKVLEFLVAILGGLAHLQDISRAAHPLDQDGMVAAAWAQPAWADYSGVSRTLAQLREGEVDDLSAALERVSQPFIDQEVALALAQSGELVYDADLTGRPVSSTSTSYPDTAFGHMGDTIELGYQAALVSLHSPTYGRLWLANALHPGSTVSTTCTQALVLAAEQRTGRRPRRRTDLLAGRVAAAQEHCQALADMVTDSAQRLQDAQEAVTITEQQRQQWAQEVDKLRTVYAAKNRPQTPHCQLSRAERKRRTYQNRLPRAQAACGVAHRRLARNEARWAEAQAAVTQLQAHYQQLVADNAANAQPIRATFRLDGGFTDRENLYWLIEMGYDVYTRGRFPTVRDALQATVSTETNWQRVGGNATMTGWRRTTVADYFVYPLDVALLQYHMGDKIQRATLLHFGQTDVVADLKTWFETYNRRQTIEAGIKEGKNVFQMHHLKVRQLGALRLQEKMACFAANFVRFAALWLGQQPQPTPFSPQSVKQMVRVAAHTSAWVRKKGDVWLLTFTEQSCYAGVSLRFGGGVTQLPLPLFKDIHFSHF